MKAYLYLFAFVLVLIISQTVAGQQNCFEITQTPQPGIDKTFGCLLVRSNGSQADDTHLLRYAITQAAQQKRKLFLSGHFFISATIAIDSNTRIEGLDGASIRNVAPLDVMLLIRSGAKDIRIDNLELLESQKIASSVISFSGRNENVVLNGVNFTGRFVSDGGNTAAVRSGVDWIRNIGIHQCAFTKFQSGIFFNTPVQELAIRGCHFTQWTDFGVYIGQKTGFVQRTRDLAVVDNQWNQPALGVIRQPLMIVKSAARLSVKNVSIIDNRVIGRTGAYVRGQQSTAQGDMVVLQGVTTFVVRGNVIRDGGENGLTVSRLSRLGLIENNVIYNNDQNGINIGSGSFDLIVDRPQNFAAGDAIEGVFSGARANIRFVDHDGTLVLDQAGVAPFFAEQVKNLSTGIKNAGFAQFTERTKSIQIRNNLVYDNGIDANDETVSSHGCLVFNADRISFVGNSFFDRNYPNSRQTLAVRCNNARSVFFGDNEFQFDDQSFDDAVFLNSSSWLAPSNCGQRPVFCGE